MIAHELYRRGSFWAFLLSIDKDLVESARQKDARAAAACTVATTREHSGAAPMIYQRSIAAGSVSAVIATAAEGG